MKGGLSGSPFVVFLYTMKAKCIILYCGLLFLSACNLVDKKAGSSFLAEKDSVPQSFIYDADVSDAFDMERLARVDSAYERAVREGLMPQCVTFVAHKGRVVHCKAYGWRNKEAAVPCQTTDIFRIASQTKAVVVVGLMMLWEEGRFQLDEPIKKYLPEFANMSVLDKYDAYTKTYIVHPAKHDITIRHLLTHTSGLSYDGYFMDICQEKGIAPLASLDSITLAENVNRMATMPLKHEPGEAFTYSMNIDVLARLIEVLTNQDLYTYMRARVLEPLGMNDTYFYLPADKRQRLVTLYAYPKGGPLQVSDKQLYQTFPYAGAQTLYCAGAGMCGTIEDYAKFCQMVLNGGEFNGHRILGRKTLEMMQRNGVGDMRGEIGFGMAWDVFRPEYLHNTILSEGSMRWGGMYGTDYVIDPQEQIVMLMYTNCMPNFSGTNYKTLMHTLVYQALK